MEAETFTGQARRSGWQWVAAGLTIAPVLLGVPALLMPGLFLPAPSDGLPWGLAILPLYAVPVVAAWWASRAEAPRAPLGLVAVLAWTAVAHVPSAAASLVAALADVTGLADGASPAAPGLALPAIAILIVMGAAWKALRIRGDAAVLRVRAGRVALRRSRRVAAAAIVVWGLASAGWAAGRLVVGLPAAVELSGAVWPPRGLALAVLVVVLVTIAAFVWRRDTLAVVPAALVVTATAVHRAGVSTVALLTDGQPLMAPGAMVQPPGSGPELLVQLVGAALVTGTTARLVLVARGVWRQHAVRA